MMRRYRYFFYRIYCWSQKVSGSNDTYALNAMLWMSLLAAVIFCSVLIIVEVSTGIPILEWIMATTLRKVLWAGTFLMLHVVLFLRPGEPERILGEFSLESKDERRKGTKMLLSYLYGPFLLLAFSFWMISLHQR